MNLKVYYWNLKKYISKQRIKKGEKCFGNDMPLKYYLEKKKGCHDLIVVYSAFPEPNKPAAYNYITTLSKLKVNKLFLLDEYGAGGKGCYYLGKNGERQVEKNVVALLDKIKSELKIQRTVHVGSSKGGWSALYYGLNYDKDEIVAGGAQYFLGDYTLDRMPALYTYLTGNEKNEEDTERLNHLVSDKIDSAKLRKIYLHYSDQEHTYQDSMLPLKNHLLEKNFPIWEDVAHYAEHGQVGLYFAELIPTLLKRILTEGTK